VHSLETDSLAVAPTAKGERVALPALFHDYEPFWR